MATATVVDAKAGFCSSCRRGAHVMCGSPTCECDMRKDHPNRPSSLPAAAARPVAVARPAEPPTTTPPPRSAPALTSPVFERVREDPPEPERKVRQTTAELVLPILADIERVGDKVWWRVALFPKRQQAAHARIAVAKALGDAAGGWEFKAVKVAPPGPGASALYARRVDR